MPRNPPTKKSKVARRARPPKPETCGHAACPHGDFMAMRRSSQMLILGLAIFVIGAGVVLVSFMGSDDGKDKSAAPTTSTTVQAGTVVVNGATPGAAPTTFTIPEGKQAVAVQ